MSGAGTRELIIRRPEYGTPIAVRSPRLGGIEAKQHVRKDTRCPGISATSSTRSSRCFRRRAGADPRRAGDHLGRGHQGAPTTWPAGLHRARRASRATRSRSTCATGRNTCEALAAGFKARLTHVNVNYRYTPEEVWYIFDNSDAQTVVYASEFRDAVVRDPRPRLPKVETWVEVSDDGKVAPLRRGATRSSSSEGNGGPLDIERSGDDQFFIYTGGTTGMPKGVMWAHDDLREITAGARRASSARCRRRSSSSPQHVKAIGPGGRTLPALSADARHRPVHRDGRDAGRRLRRHAGGRHLRRRRAAARRRAPQAADASSSSATPSPSRC